MGYLIDGYKIMGQELKQGVIKHRAGIATGVSIVGTIVSNILSTKAGAKSARMIDAKAIELGRPLTLGEKVKLCWQNHIGAVAVAGTSVAGSGYSHSAHVQDFGKVATAYAGVKKLYDENKRDTREILGEKKNTELQDKLNQKHLEEHPEAKQKILEAGPNPDPGTMRKFWEPVSGEAFYCTADRLQMAFDQMNTEMKLIPPREQNGSGWRNEGKGVMLLRLFDILNIELPVSKRQSDTFRHMAFIRGKEKDGSDDDKISAFYTPMMIDNETMETCAAINWNTEPSDIRYADYMKL